MKKLQVTDWVQIVTGITIVIGLFLVFWELQQARELAKAQLISDNVANVVAHRTALMGENPADIINKACVQPGDLTGQDIEVLNAYFWNLLSTPMNIRSIGVATGLYTPDEWQSYYPGLFSVIAGIPYGRYWWRNIESFFMRIDPELAEFGNEFMARHSGENTCSAYPQGYLQKFSATIE